MTEAAAMEERMKNLEKQNEKLTKLVGELKLQNEKLQDKIPTAGVGAVVEKFNVSNAIGILPPFFGENTDSNLKIKMLINMVEQIGKDHPHLNSQRCMIT